MSVSVKEDYQDKKDYEYNKPVCVDPAHNPPGHLYIPSGAKFIHVCPSCGKSITIRGSNISWR